MRILIAEDEHEIAKALKVILEKHKYSADIVSNGSDALEYIRQIRYDALILDIMMPLVDGLEVLKTIRSEGIYTPALFLTARTELDDRVAGLDAGADDYLAKPFAASEFLARVRALIRRSDSYAPSVLSFGNTSLNGNTYILQSAAGSVRLNNKEFQIMELFMRNPHHVFSTDHLMDRVWGLDSDTEIDVVWTNIGFLRKKLKKLNADIQIKTIRGAGYALEEGIC
ncbi:response regulator MprA [Lachnospiraceae bacterium]|jgi:DNA-binding response OmpR family regulator|nr:response regulator MprA [Lachnospiraceae bacterium]